MFLKALWERFRCFLETCYFVDLEEDRRRMAAWKNLRLTFDPDQIAGQDLDADPDSDSNDESKKKATD